MKYTVEVNGSAVVGIDFVHDVFELGFGGLETQLAHYIAELLSCDFTYVESCQQVRRRIESTLDGSLKASWRPDAYLVRKNG